ncbi:hypothetical protein [Enhygromyxa salina]|uniref:Uncharacterized protein n=1 Tax=Enhygromyxa salina TaxID=215803 RepID=A0A2S9XL88_9BACT|nr:hypothetical protein [Enhygromyxa salina]PRP93639.1 hypothetical protein ENSA7_80670 [Enhygromyxa salina]
MFYSTSRSWLCACSLLLWAGCGDDGTPAGDGTETSSGDGDGDPGDGDPGDGDGDDGDGDGDPGDGDGDPGDGDGDTGDGDGDTGDGDGDGDTGDGDGDPGNVTYTAVAQPGGLDRVFIERHDEDTDTCTRVVLVSPALIQTFNVQLPDNWSIESVTNNQPADCSVLDFDEQIESGTGVIEFLDFDQFDIFPCTINVDVQFDVAGDPPTLDFSVMNLAVMGAC